MKFAIFEDDIGKLIAVNPCAVAAIWANTVSPELVDLWLIPDIVFSVKANLTTVVERLEVLSEPPLKLRGKPTPIQRGAGG